MAVDERARAWNPFYGLVVLVGALFAVTALAYVTSLVALESPASASASAAHSPLLRFFNQRGESLLLWEAAVLAGAAVSAMGLDRWRSGQSTRTKALADCEKQTDQFAPSPPPGGRP